MRLLGALGLGWLLVAASVTAQETRADVLRRQREAKRAASTPYVPSRIEEQMVRFDKAETPTIADWNLRGFYPRIAWPSRGSGAALGFRYWQPNFFRAIDVAGAAFYSSRGYQHYDIQLGVLPHLGRQIPAKSWRGDDVYELASTELGSSRIPFYVTYRYRYLPEEDFYGLGRGSRIDDRTNYLQTEERVYLKTGYQLTGNFAWILSGGYQRNRIGSGKTSRVPSTEERFDDENAPGLSNPPDYLRYGMKVLVDYRDEPGNPHQGFMAAISLERFEDQTEDRFSFDQIGVDVRGYVPLGSPQRVLALRGAFLLNEPDDDHEVPFFLQPSLGGSHTLRGFDSFRWRGENVLLYQVEYRWEPLPFWDLDLFVDAGTVLDELEGSRGSNFAWDWGFGTRFKTYRDVVLRLEIAFSRETTRYYLRGSTSF